MSNVFDEEFTKPLVEQGFSTHRDVANAFSKVFNTCVIAECKFIGSVPESRLPDIEAYFAFRPFLHEGPATKAMTAMQATLENGGIKGITLEPLEFIGGTKIGINFPRAGSEAGHSLVTTFAKNADVSQIIEEAVKETAAEIRREERSPTKLISRMWHRGPIKGLRDHIWVLKNT